MFGMHVLKRIIHSVEHVRDVPLCCLGEIRRLDEIEQGLDTLRPMAGYTYHGVDIVVFEELDERVDGGIVACEDLDSGFLFQILIRLWSHHVSIFARNPGLSWTSGLLYYCRLTLRDMIRGVYRPSFFKASTMELPSPPDPPATATIEDIPITSLKGRGRRE